MTPPFVSSIRQFWKLLSGSVHPHDELVFAACPEHTFNLDFPPPAFVGDVDNAPIVILMSNGGYWPGETEKEFPTSQSVDEYREYLHGDRSSLPANLSKYYMRGPLAQWLTEGSAVLVNAVAYRSRKLSTKAEATNRRIANRLPSLIAHRRWLLEEVLPEASAGRRLILAHRTRWWGISRDDYDHPNVVFSEPSRAEPNRPNPDREKLKRANEWLDAFYRDKDLDAVFGLHARFADRFRNWGLQLPKPILALRRSGSIQQEGWSIQFRFGADRDGEFLDYYAGHRMMAGSEHIRLHADGRAEVLPALEDMRPVSDDPVRAEQLRNEFDQRQREIGNMLVAKGFK